MLRRTFQRIKDSPPVRLGLAVQRRYGRDSAGQMAAAITYYAFFAVLALFALALSILGFALAGDVAAQHRLARQIAGSVPGIGSLLATSIHSVAQGRALLLAVSLVGLLITGMGLVQSAGWALGRVFGVEPSGGIVKPRLWAVGSLAALGSIALASTFAAAWVAALNVTPGLAIALTLAGTVVSLALDFALFMVAYRILVQGRGPPFGKLWPGSVDGPEGDRVLVRGPDHRQVVGRVREPGDVRRDPGVPVPGGAAVPVR